MTPRRHHARTCSAVAPLILAAMSSGVWYVSLVMTSLLSSLA